MGEKKKKKNGKMVLGVGYWVQGMRCLPWMAVGFFLKDTLRVEPSTMQLLLNSANLPMLAKPLFGLLSDSNPNSRLLFISFAAFLQAVSWFAIAISAESSISLSIFTTYLLLSNLGASIAEVANDAIVAEASKQPPTSSKSRQPSSTSGEGELQSFVWMASSVGGVVGNLVGGLIINRVSPQKMFLLFGLLASVQFLITAMVRESSLDSPKRKSNAGFVKQLSKLKLALQKPAIAHSILWFAASYAVIPVLTGTMFFYQTQYLKIESSVLGVSKVFGQAAMLAWSVIYNRWLKRFPSRNVIAGVQVAMAALMVSDVLFVKGMYRSLGVPDWAYVVLVSGVLEVLFFMKILPFIVVIARLSPPGCEGSLMALVGSAIALAFIVSGYLGVALAAVVGVDSGSDFSGFPKGLLVQAVLTLVPLYWSSCIPDDHRADEDRSSSSAAATKHD